jgi:uncharacterized protein (TIGR00369 family)
VIAELQKLIAREFTRQYGFAVTEAKEGHCSLTVPYNPQFDRPDGIVSGVVFMAAADVAMWLAVKTLRGIDDPSVTSQMETHFLRSVRNASFVCNAEVLKNGRRTTFGVARCVSEGGELLAYHTLTYVMP